MSPSHRVSRRWDPTSVAIVAAVWAASRALLGVVVAWVMRSEQISLSEAIGRWDVLHFYSIAEHGYADPEEAAFFPGLPTLLRLLNSIGIAESIGGLGLALLGSGLAALALYRLFGTAAACLWLIAPNAVFCFVPYTEALFCAAAFWAWERASSKHWASAGLLAGLACTLRISGLFLIGALVLLAITQVWRHSGWWREFGARCCWLLVPAAVLFGVQLILHHATGSWTAWLDSQASGWSRSVLTSPVEALRSTWAACQTSYWPGRPEVPWIFRADLAVLVIGVLVTLIFVLRRKLGEAGWVGVQVLAFATSNWFMSANRAGLLWFPLWGLLGDAITWQPTHPGAKAAWRLTTGLLIAASVVTMVLWAWLFLTGRWAG